MSADTMLHCYICALLIVVVLIFGVNCDNGSSQVVEIDEGRMANLTCPSNDDNHIFQFWLINTKDYVGPGTTVDKHKYKYEVLTGSLLINDVSSREHGIYTCFCKHIRKFTYNVKQVELIVKRNWDEVYENDASTNMFRIFILIIVLSLIAIILFGLVFLQRRRSPLFSELFDDEAPDDDTNQPDTSFKRMVSSTTTIDTQGIDGLDTESLDTELPKGFQTQVLIGGR